MESNRYTTLFHLRCAARLLERQCRLMRRVEIAARAISFLSGTAAFAAIVGGRPVLTLLIGLLLACAQAVEFVLRPGERAARYARCARLYERPASRRGELSDAELAQSLTDAREQDDSDEIESLRRAAWNDTAAEVGAEKRLTLTRWERLVSALA
ncbi:MAG TPA: hypothetical protein DCZ11_06660 [Gammaproteobacteria bacterium]|nr:hypothetical protein [Gammaproteobacteria bacterium]MCH78107.1 hypothetical protein [Gammaproteobacteria bacterium]